MLLYHGSNINIEGIDLAMCRPYKDFGRGFYLTELKEQSRKMAERVARIYGGRAVVNIYEIDDNFRNNADIRIMDFGKSPSESWARFVMNNRSRDFTGIQSPECNHDNKYDIVIGAIADDDMTVLFRQYQNELISLESLIIGLTFRETTNQYSFHTEKAVKLLKKVGAQL